MAALVRKQPPARRPAKVTPARWVAWNVVRRTFDEEAYTDRALAGEAARAELEGRERAFAQRLAYGTVQRARRLDHVISTVGKRPLRKIDPPVLHALRLGMYELLESGDDSAHHAAVNQAVELVRATVGERAVAFANAVLRRGQADGPSILAGLDRRDPAELATLLSFPEWMVRRLGDAFQEDGIEALAAQNGGTDAARHRAFRVNALHPDAARSAELVNETGQGLVTPLPPLAADVHGVVVALGPTAELAPLVDAGLLLPQSLSSMLAARALAPQPGERVLDMCAAPGGKTTHLAALMGDSGEIVACDLHETRASSVRELAERCGATIVTTRVCDATTLAVDTDGQFDRILLDAPCSGLGVLDSRPDSRWRRSEEDVAGLVELQRHLLYAAARLLRPGGTLLYSTCTLLPEENEAQVRAALAEPELALEPAPFAAGTVPDWLALPDEPHLARVWPHLHGSAGFFLARLRRSAGA